MAITTPNGRMPSHSEPTRVRVLPLLSGLGMRRPQRRAAGYAVATLGTVALSLGLLAFRDDTTPLSKGFGFLVVVVAAAAVGGLGPGILASFLGFLAFNFFFLPPYHTFVIARAEDVVVLFVFLGLSILISALLARTTERAKAAEAREQELRTLQTLSAELVALVPGPGSYQAILSQLLDLFGFAAGALYVHDPERGELREQVTVGTAPGTLPLHPGALPLDPAERLPLSVGGRALGLLLLRGDRPPLDRAERRVLRAFCDQFALVLERDRLLHAATEAEAYRRTEHIRRSLLAAVSHDLRSPLAAIKASVTDLLGQDAQHGADDARDALDSIDKEADRLAALIANLLDMSRIEGGMLTARPQNVDLADVLSPCVDRLQRQWPHLMVRLDVEAAGCVVRADPMFLDRVVANLLDNAAKSAADSGNHQIEVHARRADGQTTVRIVDHGNGVPPTVREQLFYPFYQLTQHRVLVTELQKNARITNRALAQAAGIAESTCLERVRALHQQKVLRGYHAGVNLEPLNRHVQALIAVRLQPKTRTAVEGFRDFIITRHETLALFVVSGSDDFLVLVAVSDTRHLEAFVLDHIAQYPHIADVRTSLVYEHLQRLPIEPLDPPASPTPPQQPTHHSH